MSRWAAITIVSKPYLALARVTAQSFREHNPDIPFYMLLADDEQGRLDPTREPFQILHMEDLGITALKQFQFRHTELELSYASTPFAIQCLLRRGYDGVLFLKQETLVLDDLSSVFAKLAEHAVVLTPHLLEPPSRPDALQHEVRVLRAGIHNGGVVGFANCEEAHSFLGWWQTKVFRRCIREVKRGCHFEQRWLDFAPSLVTRYHLLRDPGVNVGHWNLLERHIHVTNGCVTAMGVPCRVFRFSGYQPEQPEMVTKYNRYLTVANTGEAAAVFARYQALLMAAGYAETRKLPYAYATYTNGVPVSERARRAYQRRTDADSKDVNPFERTSIGSFRSWFQKGANFKTR